MSFEKFHPHIQSILSRIKFNEALPFQEECLSSIKSGAHHFLIAPPGSGRTTSLIISVLQTLDCEAFEDVPRAMIFVKDKLAALELEEAFKVFTRGTDLRIFSAFDQHKFRNQKDDIYLGVDILIGTPKRLMQLFLQNGINTSQLRILALEDAEFVTRTKEQNDIIRITESLKKCQYLIISDADHPRFERFSSTFMSRSKTIST